MYNLGNLLATGRGVTQDQDRALMLYRQAAELGHAKSMNLLGRYLEEGQFCEADLPAAYDWYRRSAEGGDFRGQFSHAAILANNEKIDDALHWLGIALESGNPNFLRASSATLSGAAHPEIRALAEKYRERAVLLSEPI